MNKLLTEALFVGFATSLIGTFFSYLRMSYIYKTFNLRFNYWHTIFIAQFILGIFIHYLSEYAGLNKWYCKYGNACNK